MMLPRPARHRDERYLAWVRTLPCAVCLKPGAHAHHLSTRGSGGGDLTAVPLCAEHHGAIHTRGDRTFGDAVGVNLWRVAHDLATTYLLSKGGTDG
jgi:hypothetical protein